MGRQFGKYIIEKELGRGAAGIVYLACDPDLDRRVAIKILVVPHTFGSEERARLVERFRREARAAAGLEDPSIPRIYEVGEVTGHHYIAMEYCPGSTLAERIARKGPVPSDEAKRIMLAVLQALQVAHANRIVHRDVKAANIMLGPDGSVKLMDFGISRMESDTGLTASGMISGTPAYMAPEQAAAGPVSPATDLYAAGSVLHEMLTGEMVFPERSLPQLLHAIVYEDPQLSPRLPSEFLPIVQRCLCKDPANRFASAAEMTAGLRDAESAESRSGGVPTLVGAQVGALLRASTTEPAPAKTAVNPKDGAEMVYVPAGEFLMGSRAGEGYSNEQPQHKVYLDAYWIYKHDVSVQQYRRFSMATGCEMPDPPRWGWKDDHPVVNVTWEDAKAYCEWAGVALPTEAQWEKAARGTDGQIYPLGKGWGAMDANWRESESGRTTPMGSYPGGASPYGCQEMAGNVCQWCADWYDESYYLVSPDRNPTGPATGAFRVLRGGSWFVSPEYCRSAYRYGGSPPSSRDNCSGFRCVLRPGV